MTTATTNTIPVTEPWWLRLRDAATVVLVVQHNLLSIGVHVHPNIAVLVHIPSIHSRMPNGTPSIRVVVRLPYNRPEDALPNPPRVSA